MRHAVEQAAGAGLTDTPDIGLVVDVQALQSPQRKPRDAGLSGIVVDVGAVLGAGRGAGVLSGRPFSPLLEMERDAGDGALVAQAAKPVGMRRPCLVGALVGFSAGDHPIKAASEPWLAEPAPVVGEGIPGHVVITVGAECSQIHRPQQRLHGQEGERRIERGLGSQQLRDVTVSLILGDDGAADGGVAGPVGVGVDVEGAADAGEGVELVQPNVGADQKPLPVPVGPKSVLYAPPFSGESTSHGEWTFIEPTAASLKFLADDVKRTEDQLRELGRQPLTAQTGNLTVVTTAFAAQKGNSAVQAWALNLKDALEQAFVFTAKWLRIDEASAPSVKVFSDFDIGLNDDKGPETLTNMRSSGPNGQPDISQRTLWSEMQRRGVLAGDFDADKEEQAILDEMPDDDSDEDLGAAAGTIEDAE